MKVTRHDVDDNIFYFQRDGQELQEWYCEREVLKDGRRGHWLLMRRTIARLMEADRDQYSNDIIERLDIFLDDPDRRTPRRLTYNIRFKRQCTKAEFFEAWPTWKADLEFQFSGEWTAEYYEWEGKAVLQQVQ